MMKPFFADTNSALSPVTKHQEKALYVTSKMLPVCTIKQIHKTVYLMLHQRKLHKINPEETEAITQLWGVTPCAHQHKGHYKYKHLNLAASCILGFWVQMGARDATQAIKGSSCISDPSHQLPIHIILATSSGNMACNETVSCPMGILSLHSSPQDHWHILHHPHPAHLPYSGLLPTKKLRAQKMG